MREISNDSKFGQDLRSGAQSVRAEVDAIRSNFRTHGIASTRMAAGLSVEEARRIIEENSVGSYAFDATKLS